MATEFRLGDIAVDVVFKDIKNIYLGIHPPTGRVRISAPRRMAIEKIRSFAITKLDWIKVQQRKLQVQERESRREYLARESHYLWGERYLLEINETSRKAHVEVDHRVIKLYANAKMSAEHRRKVLEDFYRNELRAAVSLLVKKWEAKLGLRVERFYIQRMKTMWGSCNATRATIRLNLELAKKPKECLDYVVLHEILHFWVSDHSDRFVALLDEHMPGWPMLRQRLNEAPLAHVEWTL